MHSTNSQKKKKLGFVFNIAVYLKSICDPRVRITRGHNHSHFHNDNHANNNNTKKRQQQKQLLWARLHDRLFTCIISLNFYLTCKSGTIFNPFC